jgi:hypothetical protein
MLIAALAMAGSGKEAAAQNAVSTSNGKVDLRGGYERSINEGINGGFVAGTGSFTMPLGQSFGLQLDGGIGWVDSNFYGGGGAHAFWRSPTAGLLGIWTQASTLDHAYLARVGGRGELYLSGLTFGGYAGYQWGNRGDSVQVNHGVIAGIDAIGYPTENFAIKGAVGWDAGKWYGRGGLEFQPAFTNMRGLSFFADAGGGQNRQLFALGGVRFYFGPDKSLMRRHREDDPPPLPITELPQYRRNGHGHVGGGGGNDTIPE